MALNRALIFLGPPGAGKGTQARRVAQACAVPHLSTGDMLRDAIRRGTGLGQVAKPIVERGELVPDDVMMKMIEERIEQPDCAGGFVFDGFPRTLPQAEQLDRILERKGFGSPQVLDLCVGAEKLVRRLTGRWTCSTCGEIYNVYDAPPKVAGVCDRDGGKLTQRPDDRLEVVKERLTAFDRQTKPLTAYYRSKGVLETVDASAGVEEVRRSLAKIVPCAPERDGHL